MKKLLLFALIVGKLQVSLQIVTFVQVATIGYGIFDAMKNFYEVYDELGGEPSISDLMKSVEGIADSIDSLQNHIDKKIDQAIQTLLRRMRLANQMDSDIQLLNEYITRIDSLYSNLEEYIKEPDDFSTIALNQLIKAYTSNDDKDVIDTIYKMHSLIIPGRLGTLKESLLLLISQETKEYSSEMCDTHVSPQEKIVELYNILVTTEMRAFFMTSFGYLTLGLSQKVNTLKDIRRQSKVLTQRSQQYIIALKEAMQIADRHFKRCDPSDGHVREQTFYEFERFIQAFTVQENVLNSHHSCVNTCENQEKQPMTVHPGCYGFECSGSPSTCYGQLTRCWSMNDYADLCELDPSNPRRYQWVYDGFGVTNGKSGPPCEGTMYYPRGFWSGFVDCDICWCTCTEHVPKSKSSHFISLKEHTTDVDNNFVAVSMRFRIIDKIAYIQIREGRIGINGTIEDGSLRWKIIEDIEYDEERSARVNRFKFVETLEDGTRVPLYKDQDIAVLTDAARKICLDDLVVPEGHVVTGLRFRRSLKDSTRPIHLEIRATPFDHITGTVSNSASSIWITPDTENREEYENKGDYNPLDSTKTVIDTEPGVCIQIDKSNWNQDAAQTVIPLMDALEVYSSSPTPLSGVGLFHKKQDGYGGFLTLVLEAINKAPFIDTNFQPID